MEPRKYTAFTPVSESPTACASAGLRLSTFPGGEFFIDPTERPLMLISAGVGITPLRRSKVIGQFITDQRAASLEDIILVGDFNMFPGQNVSNFHHFGGNDFVEFIFCRDLQDRYRGWG